MQSTGMEKPAPPPTTAEAESQPVTDVSPDGDESWNEALNKELQEGFTSNDRMDMQRMGKKQQFRVRAPPFRSPPSPTAALLYRGA